MCFMQLSHLSTKWNISSIVIHLAAAHVQAHYILLCNLSDSYFHKISCVLRTLWLVSYCVYYQAMQHGYHFITHSFDVLYSNVTSVSIFFGCRLWSVRGHTHRWRQIHVRQVSRLVFLFSCPPNPSINHFNFYCIKLEIRIRNNPSPVSRTYLL